MNKEESQDFLQIQLANLGVDPENAAKLSKRAGGLHEVLYKLLQDNSYFPEGTAIGRKEAIRHWAFLYSLRASNLQFDYQRVQPIIKNKKTLAKIKLIAPYAWVVANLSFYELVILFGVFNAEGKLLQALARTSLIEEKIQEGRKAKSNEDEG